MNCPICNLNMTAPRKVLGLTKSAGKEFHLYHAHQVNAIKDAFELLHQINNKNKELKEKGKKPFPFGEKVEQIVNYIEEIERSRNLKWEGEDNEL